VSLIKQCGHSLLRPGCNGFAVSNVYSAGVGNRMILFWKALRLRVLVYVFTAL
jgi:hypothetical protein